MKRLTTSKAIGEAKPIRGASIINKTWKEFIKEVRAEKYHSLGERLNVINTANDYFKMEKSFNTLCVDVRGFIAGIPNKLQIEGAEDWGCFGSMRGAGMFQHLIKSNDSNISKALDEIPLSGQITRTHYNNFIKHFTKALKGNCVATATRLLSMKRPDTFICFNSRNKSKLCKDFEIVQSNMDYERYWDDIIEKIFDCDWWLNRAPKNDKEKIISEARAAFLDSLYYEEKKLNKLIN
ncbi:MAG: hypothetical protein ABSB95_07860 [Dissulfurispiraceae bacterium]|jgi:hypothetical protein